MRRYVDIKSEEFWQVLFDEACVEGSQAERIENELNKISVSEKEIRNKAIDEFAEALKESQKAYEWCCTDSPMELCDGNCEICWIKFGKEIDEIAEQLKGVQ